MNRLTSCALYGGISLVDAGLQGIGGGAGTALLNLTGAAAMCSVGNDNYCGKVGNNAIAGLVGGAVVNTGVAFLALITAPPSGAGRSSAVRLAGNLSAVGAAAIGALILRANGYENQPTPIEALFATYLGVGLIYGLGLALSSAVELVVNRHRFADEEYINALNFRTAPMVSLSSIEMV